MSREWIGFPQFQQQLLSVDVLEEYSTIFIKFLELKTHAYRIESNFSTIPQIKAYPDLEILPKLQQTHPHWSKHFDWPSIQLLPPRNYSTLGQLHPFNNIISIKCSHYLQCTLEL
jgi:hypothetical protein